MSVTRKILLFLSLFLLAACATPEKPVPATPKSNFAVYSLDPDVDLSSLSDGIAKHPYRKPEVQRRYIRAELRDAILKQENMANVLAWEEDKIDIFYKSIVNTPFQYLYEKYDFLSYGKYVRLKVLFNNPPSLKSKPDGHGENFKK